MSRADDLEHLRAQRAWVENRIQQLRPEQRWMRINLESRLRMLDEEITGADMEASTTARARVALVFGGEPVSEAGAIEATFGAKAVQVYQSLVSTTAATLGGRALKASGPIPDEERYRLFITATFPGSFGFELEEVASATGQEPGTLRKAVDEASRLLQATQLDDDAYADALTESNPRVVKALADFLGLMESRAATVRLTADERECLFETPEAVARAAERVRKTSIDEREEAVLGVLTGLLTKGRQFELQIELTGEVIRGRIASTIAEPLELMRYLNARCVAHLRIVRAPRAGKEQRSYSLTGIESLSAEETPT